MLFSIQRVGVVCIYVCTFLFGLGTTLQAATAEVAGPVAPVTPVAEITLAQAIEFALRLATVVIGGIAFFTLLTLLVLPGLYRVGYRPQRVAAADSLQTQEA